MKQPPTSNEAEQGVLGCIMLDSTALDKAADTLTAGDFYREGHRQIYTAMQGLANRGEPIDILTMVEALRQTDKLERAGGAAYIAGLPDMVPAAAHVVSYARIVHEKAMLRGVIATAQGIAARAYEDTGDVGEFMDEAESAIYAATNDRAARPIMSFQDNVIDSLADIEDVKEGRKPPGLMTGYYELDALLTGFHPGDLIILAANTGVGKTAFALNIICKITFGTPLTGLYFTVEMTARELGKRALCASARVDAQDVRTGNLTDAQFAKLQEKAISRQDAGLFIDDSPGLSIASFRSRTRRMKSEHDIALVVVDYLQLMEGDRTKHGTREQEVSSVARALKSTARELAVPVLALCQLNRNVSNRKPPKPALSDLRESGAIEQNADVVVFMYPPFDEDDWSYDKKKLLWT